MAKKSKKNAFGVGTVFDLASEARDALKGADEPVCLRVHVAEGCPRELALAVKEALVAQKPGGVVEVTGMMPPAPTATRPDAVVVLVGRGDAAPLAAGYAMGGVPVALVVEGALDAPEFSLPEAAADLVDVLAASSADALAPKLGQWLIDATDGKDLALAANFPCCRKPVVDSLVTRCAVENAAVGAVSFIPGSDFPIMTVAQAKLALDIAAAYGRGLDLYRAVELACVAGAGYAYRSIARVVAGLVPGVGLFLKAGIAYGGTVATGNAVRLRFEAEDDGVEPAGFVTDLVSRFTPKESVPEPRPVETRGLISGPVRSDYVTIGEAGR